MGNMDLAHAIGWLRITLTVAMVASEPCSSHGFEVVLSLPLATVGVGAECQLPRSKTPPQGKEEREREKANLRNRLYLGFIIA
jgi:hypothetical protein